MRRLLPIAFAGVLVWGCSKDSSTPASATPAPATPCNYTLSITSQSVVAGGGSGTSTLTRTSGSCGWTATSDSSFITVATGSGSDSATVSFTVAANAGTESRTGRITVNWNGGSSQLTVTQAGTPAPPPPPPPQPCTYSLEPVGFIIPGVGGTGQATLTVTGTNCSWSAQSNQFWITINAGYSGTTTGTIAFTVAANPGPQRFGRIIITHTVGTTDLGFTQDPQPTTAVLTVTPNPCDLQANPNPPNTDNTKNRNRLECTFDASGSLAPSGISTYDFWLGGTPAGVDSFLLGSSGTPIITFPVIGCGYSGGGDTTVNVYVIVNPNSGAPVISAPLPLTIRKNGSC